MEINIDETKYNILIHDLVTISTYLGSVANSFDEFTMLEYKNRLLEIRQELIENTETKD